MNNTAPDSSDLPQAVHQLIETLDQTDGNPKLDGLKEAATKHRDEPDTDEGHRHLSERLTDALHHLESDHPTLVKAINDVSYYLSGLGI